MERPDVTQIAIAGACVLFIAFAVWQIYIFHGRRAEARARYDAAAQDLDAARAENERLKAEMHFYEDPENLEKEVRARFNYREPDEKTIIFVPSSTAQ